MKRWVKGQNYRILAVLPELDGILTFGKSIIAVIETSIQKLYGKAA